MAVDNIKVKITVDDSDVKEAAKSFDKLTEEEKQLRRETERATSAAQKQDAQLSRSAKSAKSTGLSFKKLGLAIGAAFAVQKIIQFTKTVITTFADFELAIAQVAAISGATEAELESLEQSALELGRTTAFTASQVAGLQIELAKLGFDPKEIDDSTESILNLAFAFNNDLAQTATVAASTLNAFGLRTTEMTRVTDVMAKSFASSGLDLENFTESMKLVAPIAKIANIPLETTSALLGVLATNGLKGSLAGTGLKNVISKLSNGSSELASKLGFSVKNSDDLFRAFDILKEGNIDLTEATELTDERSKAAFLTMLGGIDNVKDLSNEFLNAEGTAKKMADAMGETTSGALKRLDSVIEDLNIRMGKDAAGAINTVISLITALISEFDTLKNAIVDIFSPFGTLFESLIDLLDSFGFAVRDAGDEASGARTAIKLLASALQIVFIPMKLLLNSVILLVDGFRVLVNTAKKTANFFGASFELDPNATFSKLGDDLMGFVDVFTDVAKPFQDTKDAVKDTTKEIAADNEKLTREMERQAEARRRITEKEKKALEKAAKERDKINQKIQDDIKKRQDIALIDLATNENAKKIITIRIAQKAAEEELDIAASMKGQKKAALEAIEQDRVLVIAEANRQIAALNEAVDVQAQAKAKERNDRLLALDKDLQNRRALLKLEGLEKEKQEEVQRAEAARAKVQLDLENGVINEQIKNSSLEVLAEEHAQKIKAIEERTQEEREARNKRQLQAAATTMGAIGDAVQNFGDLFAQVTKDGEERSKAFYALQKGIAIAEVAINTALAITNALKLPAPFNFIAQAAIAASGAAQAAIIASQPSGFAQGVINLQGAGNGTSDSIPAMLSKGETVITAKRTAQYHKELEMIQSGVFPSNGFSPVAFGTGATNFDDSNLIAAIKKHSQTVSVNVDQNGFATYMSKQMKTTNYLDNRYKS